MGALHVRVSLIGRRPIFQGPHDCNRECAGVGQTRDRDTPLQAHARTELARGFPLSNSRVIQLLPGSRK